MSVASITADDVRAVAAKFHVRLIRGDSYGFAATGEYRLKGCLLGFLMLHRLQRLEEVAGYRTNAHRERFDLVADYVAAKLQLSRLYTNGLEDGFEGCTPDKTNNSDYMAGHEQGRAISEELFS